MKLYTLTFTLSALKKIVVLVTPVRYYGKMLDKNNFGKRHLLGSQFKNTFSSWWRREHDVTGHMASILGKQRDERRCWLPPFYSAQDPADELMLPTPRNCHIYIPRGLLPW